jgi:hypothetical protein
MSNVFNETIFLKAGSSQDMRLSLLESSKYLTPSEKEEMYILKKGMSGEKQVIYQLGKANEGMYVLRDVNFEYNGMTAQIDFIIITSHHCFFVECKNYTGNIEINKSGEFVVNSRPGKKNGRMGIKSPVNQVEDQLEVFKKICLENVEKTKELLNGIKFNNYFKTLVVFTNPQNIIKAGEAPREVRTKVIKVDELVRYIKRYSDSYEDKRLNKNEMNALGEYLFNLNVGKGFNNSTFYSQNVSNKKTKNNKNVLIYIAVVFSIIIIGLLILLLCIKSLSNTINDYDSKYGKDKISYPVELTDNQKKALDVFKAGYDDSQKNGFTIIHTSVCREINYFFKNDINCNKDPIEVSYSGETEIKFYRPLSKTCYKLELSNGKKKVKSAEYKVINDDSCRGNPMGFVEWDDNNDYYKKIGGYEKIKEMATYAYVNNAFVSNYYDFSHITERGGDEGSNPIYRMNVDMFFSALTGKGYDIKSGTSKEDFEKMVESYYYIMKE